MPYFNIKSSPISFGQLNNIGLSVGNQTTTTSANEFYELEPAIVLDVILDETHPEIVNKRHLVDIRNIPANYKNELPNQKDIDYSYIGACRVRLCFSQQGLEKEKLSWAFPMESTGIVEYPLLNEVVIVVKYLDKLFYTRKLNLNGFINQESNFRLEKFYGNNNGNKDLVSEDGIKNESPEGPISLNSFKKIANNQVKGVLGSYFLANSKIRKLRRYEGDTVFESRHGQSIRFSSYDDVRDNDKGFYSDYKGDPTVNPPNEGCGNPMVLIRNRQRKLSLDKPILVHPKLPSIPAITDSQKNVGGLIDEDINHDGSSIYITSGLTKSKWRTTCYKSIFQQGKEEQPLFSPNGSTAYNFDIENLKGDQIVINTDRLILSSRFGETLHFSKERYGIVTDSEYTVDAHDQIVMTTNNKTVFNSPAIYLGQYGQTNEPVLLGQTTVDWLYDLCNWLLNHVHWYNHTHPKTGNANPNKTQESVQDKQLKFLRDNLDKLMSRRVFVTGGGYAPGADGIMPEGFKNATAPVSVNIVSGQGLPGTFKGKVRREGPVEIQYEEI